MSEVSIPKGSAAALKNKLSGRKYEQIYTSDPLAEVDAATKEKVSQLENYIMKNCLWQFNSRGWDRRKQNEGVMSMTTVLLCDEPVGNLTPQEKCYWVDAVFLERTYRAQFPWIKTIAKDDIKSLMRTLHARIDWLTIDGSLNLELTNTNY